MSNTNPAANVLLSTVAGAATMAHPAMIAACRLAYRVAPLVGDVLLIGAVRRAWNRADAELVHAYVVGLVAQLAEMPGMWDLYVEARSAAAALAELFA